MKESPVQRLILDWLAAEHIFSLRMNTGVAKFDDRFVKFGVKGMADILAFMGSNRIRLCGATKCAGVMPVWIETKSPTGKQSEFQKSFQKQVEDEGHVYILAKTLEAVQERMKA